MIHQDPAIGQAGVYPGMITITGQCDLIARFCSDIADHHMVPLTTWIPPVPNRSITSIPCPCLIKIGFLGIRNLMKSVPSALMMQMAVFQFQTSGAVTYRRKNTSLSPVLDHDGLKSQCPEVRGF